MTGGFPLSTNHIKLKFMEVNLWHFSIAQLLLCRPSLWASAVPCVFGAVSTFWKVTARITLPASRKQLVAGGGVALIGVTLVPLLSGLLG